MKRLIYTGYNSAESYCSFTRAALPNTQNTTLSSDVAATDSENGSSYESTASDEDPNEDVEDVMPSSECNNIADENQDDGECDDGVRSQLHQLPLGPPILFHRRRRRTAFTSEQVQQISCSAI